MHNRATISALCAIALTGCITPPAEPGVTTLAGTTWQLHAIQSMDDAQGTTRVDEPQRFTLTFGADGQADLRLDCNRGSGTWKAEPAGPDSGSLTFGPIAATRAMCPPPNLGDRLARDLAYVRGYRLKVGNLYLSLMADGGIYEWHPARE